MPTNQYEQDAYELGVEHARNAAKWACDGNTPHGHIARVMAMLDAGDPEASDHLPHRPTLPREFADDLMPKALAALAAAYERGVDDTFETECERILRAAL